MPCDSSSVEHRGDRADPDGTVALADGEAETGAHGDRSAEGHLHVHDIARPDLSDLAVAADYAGHSHLHGDACQRRAARRTGGERDRQLEQLDGTVLGDGCGRSNQRELSSSGGAGERRHDGCGDRERQRGVEVVQFADICKERFPVFYRVKS